MNGTRRFSRRRFLQSAAATGGVLTLGGLGSVQRVFSQSALPSPDASGIDHIVVLMMENRSFDHMLGWLDGADGRQRGLTLSRRRRACRIATYRLAPDFQGCGHPDPDHSYEGGRIEYNDGACDGWLRAGNNDEFAIGYYTQDRTCRSSAGRRRAWTVCDRYFSAIMARHIRRTGSTSTPRRPTGWRTRSTLCTLPTIWDRLADAGLDGRYYFSDLPVPGAVGQQSTLPIAQPVDARSSPTPPPARCRTCRSSSRGSSARRSARRTTIIRSPTSATARRS